MRHTIIALPLLLSACAGALPWNTQSKAGITDAVVTWCESKDATKDKYVCGARLTDGKEKTYIALKIDTPDGSHLKYTARDVKAFQGQQVRAAVEKAVSADVKAAAPGIVDAIVKAILGL